MSLDAILTKLLAGSTRAEKIAILASQTDELTGIINGTTKVAKSYFEDEGPASNTGTIYAAMVDVINILGGVDTFTGMNLNGVLSVGTDRVGINSVASADRFQVGYAALFDVSIFVEGGAVFNDDVNLTGGGNVVLYPDGLGNGFLSIGPDGLIRAKEGYIGSRLNSPFTFLERDDGANIFRMPWNYTDYSSLPGSSAHLAGGFHFWRDGSEDFGANSLSDTPVMSITRNANMYLGRYGWVDIVNTGALSGTGTELNIISDEGSAGSWINLLSKDGTSVLQGITFNVGWGGAGDNATQGDDVWQILHQVTTENYFGIKYKSSYLLESWPMRIDVDDTGEESFFDIIALKKLDASYYKTHLRVLSNLSSVDYFVDICPQFDQIPLRTNTVGSPVPGISMSNGIVGNLARIGPDSWHDDVAMRIWWESVTGNTRGVIAIGEASEHGAGGRLFPIDPFVIIPETSAVGINIDNIWVSNLAGMQKAGLWVGGGADEVGGKIFLQDETGHRGAILFGQTSEPYWLFLKNGAPVIADYSTADPDALGTSGELGRQEILLAETSEDLTTAPGRASARTEILSAVSDMDNGNCAAVFVRDQSDVGMLFVEVQDGASRRTFYFTATDSWTT